MPLSRSDLGDFAYLRAIAMHGSFRRAATQMEVTPSALSHAISGLEERLGVRLLNRTTRSVTLTAAGEGLIEAIGEPLETIEKAVENLNRYRDTPTGRIRISVLEDAATLLLGPVLPVFLERYPGVEVDISVDNRMIDVIASGFDAGIRHGATVPEDMIARRVSADFRWVTAAAPAYLDRFGRPQHPGDLYNHRCVRIRLGNDQIYHWEFEAEGEPIRIEAPGQVTVGSSAAMQQLAAEGVGIVYGPEPVLRGLVARGDLEFVLEDFAPLGPAYHIYYSSRRHVPTGLRLLSDLIREMKPCGL